MVYGNYKELKDKLTSENPNLNQDVVEVTSYFIHHAATQQAFNQASQLANALDGIKGDTDVKAVLTVGGMYLPSVINAVNSAKGKKETAAVVKYASLIANKIYERLDKLTDKDKEIIGSNKELKQAYEQTAGIYEKFRTDKKGNLISQIKDKNGNIAPITPDAIKQMIDQLVEQSKEAAKQQRSGKATEQQAEEEGQ